MNGRDLIEAGGVFLVIGGFVTAAYLATEANFGFILPALYQINIAIGIFAASLIVFWKPRLAPVGAGLGAFLAVDTFFISFNDPLWALPSVVGAVLCLLGWGLTLFGNRSEAPTTAA
jgi:hypothetical protein